MYLLYFRGPVNKRNKKREKIMDSFKRKRKTFKFIILGIPMFW